MNERGLRRTLPDQSSGSVHTFGNPSHPSIINPILSKRVCFYKSGDPQFSGLRMVINNRTFKTFDALLDSLSKKVPLPFGVRNITTPRGVHAIYSLDELEDGKSYICSESRKVKPINLALARKKLLPWYHARPVSSRRRTVQQARFFPGRNIHRQEPVVVRTPKRLLVFRNGQPSVRHTVLLQKRTTPTFDSLLEYISELMQFHVVKLHTPDGRRVDGLTGLILCSGTVVAAGREPFRSANYNAQKSTAPTRRPSKRLILRRRKALNRKKKSLSYATRSRHFSSLSERYIVDRIHSSIAESSCNLPSNATNSMELESSHLLQSVAEMEDDTCVGEGTEGQGCLPPTDDDIEKSFQVNQDGSMTVEMRVRLTIKEEETVHWTTTLTRSSAANQFNVACLPEPEPEQVYSSNSDSLDLQNPVASIDAINRDKTTDDNDEDPPSLGNGAVSKCNSDEDNIKVQTDVVSPRRVPTPGHKTIRKEQASLGCIKSATAEEIQEGMVESYLYRELTENKNITEQYCMVKQSSTRPVPKPRRLGSVDERRNVSTFNSASTSEILQIESGEEEVTETVLHIYEQQACVDNFLANICASETSTSGMSFCRPATSETGQFSFNNECEPELWRPSTASESISIWRAGDMSVTLPPQETGALQTTKRQQQFPKSTIYKEKPHQREVNTDKRISFKPKVINRHVHRLMSPGKRQNKTSAEATEKQKKVNTFSSAGFIKGIYGNKSKSAKSVMKLKKRPTQNKRESVTTRSSQSSDDTIKDSNMPSPQEIHTSEKVSSETTGLIASVTEANQPRGILTRQPSMHQENKTNKNKSYDVSESMSLPAFNSSSSVTNEYVENWLVKAQLNTTAYANVECKKLEAIVHVKTENVCELITAAEEAKCHEEKLEMQTCQRFTIDSLPVQGTSVKQRIQSFEKKSGPSVETTTVMQQVAHSSAISTNRENINTFTQNNTDEMNPHSNYIFSELNPLTNMASTELLPGSEGENNSRPVRISIQEATSSSTLSMEPLIPLSPSPPPPPPPTVNPVDVQVDVTSVVSSPLYRLSSLSSQTSEIQPLSISPTSDNGESLSDHTMETITSFQTDIPVTLKEAQLQRTPSIKRATLVSNLSLERKMSLKKACLDKYTLCSDETLETCTSSFLTNRVSDDVLPYDICSTETQQPSKTQSEETQQSMLDLTSSQRYTSEEKISSDSNSTSDAPTPGNLPFKETKTINTRSSTQVSSPKALEKKGKLISSPSTERKPQTKKVSSELPHNSPKLSSLHNHPLDKSMSPNVTRKQATSTTNPSPERKQKLSKSKLQNIASPYSQSLDMVSPPVRHRSNRKLLSRNVSSDNASEPTNKTKRKSPSRSKQHQTQQSIKLTDELDKTSETSDQSDDNKVNETVYLTKADHVKSMTDTQMSQPLNIANQPNMKPVLDKICSSIKSIRQITQNKRQSCLKKSNSLPDFSSHVASTFGSSSKALLAFLSVMTLKEAITNFNMDELNANHVSCAEALKMIESLREIASIEDSHKLKTSLSDLQKSASKQLLESWRGFQELSDKCKSHSSTPNYSEQDCVSGSSPDIEENVIDEIMGGLDIPETLREELASLSVDTRHESDNEEQLYSEVLYMRESSKDMETCREVEKQQQCHNEDTLNQEQANMSSSQSYSSEIEKQDMECRQSEESICLPETEPTYNSESGSDDEGQKMSSTCKGLEQEVSFKESVSSSEAGEQQSSEREKISEIKHESRKRDLSDPESDFEASRGNYYVELNATRKGSTSSPESENLGQSLGSVDEQPEVECEELSNKDALSYPATPESPTGSMGLNASANKSICNLDVDEPSSSEEEVECEELKVIVEENLLDPEEEHESGEEKKHLSDHKEQMKMSEELNSWREKTEENQVSSENEDIHARNSVRRYSSKLLESPDSYIIKDSSSSIEQSENLAKRYSFDVEEDSGNDHTCCEEHEKIVQPKAKDKQISSSTDEELSYYKKESSSAIAKLPETTKCEKVVGKPQTKDTISKSVTQMETITKSSAITQVSQKDVPLVSDTGEISSESPTSQSTLCTQSAPQSSLSFSYDSSGVITTETEGSRVKSIREMFLAKGSTDIQHRQKPLPSQKTSKLSELRAETSASGGYQSQTSSELSGAEEDSSRTSITKGFVRRAIERLYGNKENPDEVASVKLPSESKQKKKEHSSIFAHIARTKAVSELSYFNSTNAMDTINEATRCIAFNAQVGPEDSVPIDKERWLLRENTQMRKSLSDPVGINKNCPNEEVMCEDTEEHTPYSIFSTKSEPEDTNKSVPRKCTYFSLPHASDSDICQEELSTVSKSSVNGDSVIEAENNSEDTKTWAERNGMLPGVGISDFKMMDNKVHPLVEVPPDGEAVVVQPRKGQGAINRRLPEPDMLDLLYNFCGQHCPIL